MCKVISVISCKGGVGKTTSAVNISAYLQMQGKRVCVVDLDAQHMPDFLHPFPPFTYTISSAFSCIFISALTCESVVRIP